jgi:protein-S-isoprenylcysteine O-methyltransferase Ste14
VQLTESRRSMDLERIVLIPIFTFFLFLSSDALFGQVSAPLSGLEGILVLIYRVLLVTYNVLLVILLLARSDAKATSSSMLPRIAAYAGTFGPFLLGFAESSEVTPGLALVGVSLQAAGMAFVVYSLSILRRSFGVAPQVRELVRHGPYRYIRHPLYVGEIVALTGAVLVGPSWQKLLILGVTAALQVYRAVQEERLMSRHDEDYAQYMKVTSRFVPGVF